MLTMYKSFILSLLHNMACMEKFMYSECRLDYFTVIHGSGWS